MTTFSQYYEENLYPLQNGVLNIVEKCDKNFYLTGGTAVSRGYYNHRYSDDLDFFTNGDENFDEHVHNILDNLKDNSYFWNNENEIIDTDDFVSIHLHHSNFSQALKIDFVNDVPVHFGDIQKTKIFSRTDSIQNILTNKLSAIFRYEEKDIADIYEICLHEKFNWADLISLAQQKEAMVDAEAISSVIDGMPEREFENIKWITSPDWETFCTHRRQIIQDICWLRDNSLIKK